MELAKNVTVERRKNVVLMMHFIHLALSLAVTEDKRRFGKESKNFVFCFAFLSPCTIFANT